MKNALLLVVGIAWLSGCVVIALSEAMANPETGGSALLFAILGLYGLIPMYVARGK